MLHLKMYVTCFNFYFELVLFLSGKAVCLFPGFSLLLITLLDVELVLCNQLLCNRNIYALYIYIHFFSLFFVCGF